MSIRAGVSYTARARLTNWSSCMIQLVSVGLACPAVWPALARLCGRSSPGCVASSSPAEWPVLVRLCGRSLSGWVAGCLSRPACARYCDPTPGCLIWRLPFFAWSDSFNLLDLWVQCPGTVHCLTLTTASETRGGAMLLHLFLKWIKRY